MPINSFMVFAQMVETNNPKLRMAPLGNILDMRKVHAGCKITFGCEANVMDDVFADRVVGGLIVVDREEFARIKVLLAESSDATSARLAALEAQLAEARKDAERLKAEAYQIALGCVDYSGGYRGHDLEVYHHGMDTVAKSLKAWREKDPSYQVQVVQAIGAARESEGKA